MRTTLNIDEDVLEITKKIAAKRKVSLGCVISELAKEGMEREKAENEQAERALSPRTIHSKSR
jgi:hypothetical protein